MDIGDLGVISGFIVGMLVVAAFFLISKNRKVETVVATRPKDTLSYTINDSLDNVRTAIRWFEPSKFKVDYEDDAQGLIVLGENIGMTKFHNGYWLMIYLSELQDGSTKVEIGIKSKVYQYPFLLRIIRNKVANRLCQAITGQIRLKQ